MNRHPAGRWVTALCSSAVVALALVPTPGSSQTPLALAAPEGDADSCTMAGLRGTYVVSLNGFTTANNQPDPTGSISNFAPVMEIGTFIFNGQGSVSRAVTVSVGGLPFQVKDSGTYVVNSDCSGSIALPTNSDTFNFNVVDEDSVAIVAMTPNQSGAGTLKRQQIRNCRTETFFGTYVFNGNGFGTYQPAPPPYPYSMDVFFPVSVVGTWVFDGKGKVTRSLSLSFDGFPLPYPDQGSYLVNSDCSLSAYFSSDNEPFQLNAINARTLVVGVVAPGRAGAGTLVKQTL
jgi:hypothetical protein